MNLSCKTLTHSRDQAVFMHPSGIALQIASLLSQTGIPAILRQYRDLYHFSKPYQYLHHSLIQRSRYRIMRKPIFSENSVPTPPHLILTLINYLWNSGRKRYHNIQTTISNDDDVTAFHVIYNNLITSLLIIKMSRVSSKANDDNILIGQKNDVMPHFKEAT